MTFSGQSFTHQGPGLSRALVVIVPLFIALVYAIALPAAEKDDGSGIPHVGEKAREQFLQYQYAAGHKAFAIAPGGAWAWLTEAETEDQAGQQAIQSCQENTRQKCVLYALNDRIVFDADNWPTLWGPYADAATAGKATRGTRVGQRFHDLTWLDAKDKRIPLSSMKGKIVILHFWGSWCPPCMREFPELKKLHGEINKRYPGDVELVMMQLREPFTDSRQWAQRYGFSGLPLYDSGVEDSDTTTLTLNNGTRIEDRSVAPVFPSSHVLDRNGLVIFSHQGPISNWLEYVAFIDHAVKTTADSCTSTTKKHGDSSGS